MGKGQHEVRKHMHRYTNVVAQMARKKWGQLGVDVMRQCNFPGCTKTKTTWEKV